MHKDFFLVVQQPCFNIGRLIVEVPRSHTHNYIHTFYTTPLDEWSILHRDNLVTPTIYKK